MEARPDWGEISAALMAERNALVRPDGGIAVTPALARTLRRCAACRHRRRHPCDAHLPPADRHRLACARPGGLFHGTDETGAPLVCDLNITGCQAFQEARG